MDPKHAEHLKAGARVVVPFGQIASEMSGTPPLLTTATVVERDPAGGHFAGDGVWLEVDIAQGQTLPQRYRVEEVLGFVFPLAEVTRHEDGSLTGRIEGYVGP